MTHCNVNLEANYQLACFYSLDRGILVPANLLDCVDKLPEYRIVFVNVIGGI